MDLFGLHKIMDSEALLLIFYFLRNLSKTNEILKDLCLNPKDYMDFTSTPVDFA